MKNMKWHRLKEVFGNALDVPTERRDAWLEERCAGSPELLAEVRTLLDHRAHMTGFLGRPVFANGEPGTVPDESVSRTSAETIARGVCAATLTPGDELVQRYEVGKRIGIGAFGAVHEATDKLTGRSVAIKAIGAGAVEDATRMRREVAVLRRVRLPGVVRLLDDWATADSTYIVMELIEGSAFPGLEQPLDWESLAPRAIALLEALGRLHWAGVVHRDIKPPNVLVDDTGRVTIVDFGVAWEVDASALRTPAEYIVGTPQYMSPERLLGQRATRSADIYSVGAMLWESLTGEPLHEGNTIAEMIGRRCNHPARPLRTVAPDVPAEIAELIDGMVRINPEERPSSAAQLAARMGGAAEFHAAQELPRVGSPEIVDQIVASGRARRSLFVIGAQGMGKSRALADAAQRLSAEGFRVATAAASVEPYGSLAPVTGPVPADPDWTLEDARAWVDRRLASALGAGVIVVADDPDTLDPWSVEALDALDEQGCVLRTRTGDVGPGLALAPLSREDLHALFSGPDRLHHLREDAAKLLHERTTGIPARVVDEIQRWVRDGVVRFEGRRAVVDRPSLDRYASQPHSDLPPRDVAIEHLPVAVRDLMALLEIASRRVPLADLSHMAGVPPWQAEVTLRKLLEHDVVAREPDGCVRPTARIGAAALWDDERRAAAHAAVADTLPGGSEERLFHLIAANQLEKAPREACDVAQRVLASGDARRAFAALEEALALLRRGGAPDVDTEEAALTLLVECALTLGTTSALDLTLYHIERLRSPSRRTRAYEKVARAALLAVRGDAARALQLLDDERDDGDAALSRARQNVRAVAARFSAPDVERSVLYQAALWVRRHPSRRNRSLLAAWVGWMRYRQERFLAAARCHQRAARLQRSPNVRLSAMLDSATAMLEAGALEEARESASRARELAAGLRHVLQEARAEQVLRAVAYRSDAAEGPDLELLDAVDRLGYPNEEGMIYLTEAATAWRRGRAELAHGLADESARRFAAAGLRWGRLLARTLSLACTRAVASEEAEALLAEARLCPLPGITVQSVGLLTDAWAEPADECREVAGRAAERIAAGDSTLR